MTDNSDNLNDVQKMIAEFGLSSSAGMSTYQAEQVLKWAIEESDPENAKALLDVFSNYGGMDIVSEAFERMRRIN